ncbi:MAG TPA: tail fiber domain-containing protein [Chryseolinea sp.]|nr:tail fiber domain-containing protein [Chryseolinea sp.]
MKKALLFFVLMQAAFAPMLAQTHYGTGAGTLGTGHNYFGYYAGNAATNTSSYNSFFGTRSGQNTNTGYSNTGLGSSALAGNSGGFYNTAIGIEALANNERGSQSVAVGRQALLASNSIGLNTAFGCRALCSFYGYNYTSSPELANTAVGTFALYYDVFGGSNVAVGFRTLYSSTGLMNTATGARAMEEDTNGQFNAAFGFRSLAKTLGSRNSAFGYETLYSEDWEECDGVKNTAFGAYAGFAQTAGCNLQNTTAIGYNARVTASNQIRFGNSSVTSIGGQVSWSNISDGRFKKDVRKDVAGLEFINQLNPVSYTLDHEAIDKFLSIPDNMPVPNSQARNPIQYQTGFIAQEVEATLKKSHYVFSGVEAPKNEGDPYTIRYAEFVVPLVKAVQELSGIGDARSRDIMQLKNTLRDFIESDSAEVVHYKGAQPSPEEGVLPDGTEIHIDVPVATTRVSLIIYDVEGRELKDILVNERGYAAIEISDKDLKPGAYLYALIADGEVLDTDQLELR